MPLPATKQHAIAKAKRTHEPVALVEMDSGDSTARYLTDEDYLASDEFKAFDGRVLLIAYPDGSIDSDFDD